MYLPEFWVGVCAGTGLTLAFLLIWAAILTATKRSKP